MRAALNFPGEGEYAPYYKTYIDAAASKLAAAGIPDVRVLMEQQCDELAALVANCSEAQAELAYAPGKWTLKESLLHTSDTERVFTYRMLRVARGDSTPLLGFDHDAYVPQSRAHARTVAGIMAEFRAVRSATLALVNSLDATALAQHGTASNQPVSALGLCWIVAGHVTHHIGLVRDRYLPALTAAT